MPYLLQESAQMLDTESVKRGGAVKHNRMFLDHFLKNIPNFRLKSLYHFLCIFYIMCCSVCHKFFHNKRFKQFDCHLFRKTALINLKFRSYDDNRTSRIVDTFSKQVLTERPDLPFSISESDFSALFPGPVTGRPRRPLSIKASTAS